MNLLYPDPYRMVFASLLFSTLLGLSILFYKFIYPKKKINLFFLLILISILPIISIFREGTYQAGDLSLHSAYLQGFYNNLKLGILVPRWGADFCGGYGCPNFMFEYMLPFYIGSVFHFIGFSFINSMKLFLASSYILSGITMYLFIKDEYGDKSAFVASLLYLFAPIRFIEMHFRVSVGTDAAFIFIPLSFLFAKKIADGKNIYVSLFAINLLLLTLAHSSSAFMIIPLSILYALFKLKDKKQLVHLIIACVLGAGLTAYYVFPALSEIKYTWYNPNVVVKYTKEAFFPIWYYLFSPARYGLLFQGNQGELRLIVGYPHLFIFILGTILLIKSKFPKKETLAVTLILLFTFISFCMMLSFTAPLWNNIFFFKSFVLPWRMLIPIAFFTSFLSAFIVKKWNNKILILFCLFVVLSTVLNWGNRKMVPPNPNEYQNTWIMYSEYFKPNNPLYLHRLNTRLPIADTLVLNHPKSHLVIISGKGQYKEIERTPILHKYIVSASTNLNIIDNTYYFPGWNVYANGKPIHLNIENPLKFGAISFNLKPGLYIIEAKFENTNIINIGNLTSFLSFIILISLFFSSKYIIKFK